MSPAPSRARWWWLATLAWLGAIFAVSSTPGDDLPSVDVPGLDKLAHGLEYAILALLAGKALLISRAPERSAGLRWWMLFPALVAIAILDELHQAWIPGRDPSAVDALADTLGALLALAWLYCRTVRCAHAVRD